MPLAKPRISAAVSPFARSAMSRPPASAGARSPVAMRPSSASAVDSSKASPASSFSRSLPGSIVMAVSRSLGLRIEEILEQCRPFGRQHALGVKLHAFDLQMPVPDAHDLAVGRARRNDEVGRHALAIRGERMIAPDLERVRNPAVERLAVVLDERGLAVHERARADDLAAEVLDDALVPQANAEHRELARERLDHRERDTRVVGTSRSRWDHEV